jgi:uncharacterized ferredoxin-like protein
MMIEKGEDILARTVESVADAMCVAAQTAPKAKGQNLISTLVVKGETIEELSEKMLEIASRAKAAFFQRDSQSIKSAAAIVLVGTKIVSAGVRGCGYCGFADCEDREKHLPAICAFSAGDLGIALGSALSIAADNRVDNRVMLSIGKAAIELGFFDADVKIAYGIPLSATSKNPFFDR